MGIADTTSAESLGIPAEAACVYQLSSKSDFGAVLMTEPEVWREGYYHESPFISWARQNSERLAQIRPEIKTNGLFAVRWTYTTKKCALNAWTNKDKVVTVGFKAKANAIGEVAPHGSWYQSSSDGGWIESVAVKVCDLTRMRNITESNRKTSGVWSSWVDHILYGVVWQARG
jgi:hypothetical protein